MLLTRYDPFWDIARGSVFHPLLNTENTGDRHLIPPVDLKESEKHWTFLFNLPGIKSEDVNITVDKGILAIEARTVEEHKDENARYAHIERREGIYKRRFELPETADAEAVAAKMEDGLLRITFDKVAEAQPQKVIVQ